MGLLEKLQAIGCRLKLVQMVPKTSAVHKKIETRNVTLQELKSELQTENARILAEPPIEFTIQFEKIFETAGIVCPSIGWTIEHFNNLLRTAPCNKMDADSRQKMVSEKLVAEKISVQNLTKEALAKVQALNEFEKFIVKKAKERSSARQMRLVEIEKQIGLILQEKHRLQQDDRNEPLQLSEWQKRKQTYEKETLETMDFLTNCTEQYSDKINRNRVR